MVLRCGWVCSCESGLCILQGCCVESQLCLCLAQGLDLAQNGSSLVPGPSCSCPAPLSELSFSVVMHSKTVFEDTANLSGAGC